MIFRNEVFPREGIPGGGKTNFDLARSPDGIAWTVDETPLIVYEDPAVKKLYDPRLICLATTPLADLLTLCEPVN